MALALVCVAGNHEREREPERAEEAEGAEPAVVDDRALEPPIGVTTPEPQWIEHRVAPRESLSQIGYRYGVSPRQLQAWNSRLARKGLRKGMTLRVKTTLPAPSRTRVEHVAEPAQTWGSIAREHGARRKDVRAINVTTIGRTLESGETVVVFEDPVVMAGIAYDYAPPGPARAIPSGAYSIGSPNEGELVNAVSIPPGPGYVLRYPKSAFGTTHAVRSTVTALEWFRRTTTYKGTIKLGAMSRVNGTKLGHHKSHQSGRDLDVTVPLREGIPTSLKPTRRRTDWLATYHLLQAFVSTGATTVIFLDYSAQKRVYRAAKKAGVPQRELEALLQYPRGRSASRGIVRDEPGHDRHFHVRFECGPYEPECVGPSALAPVTPR